MSNYRQVNVNFAFVRHGYGCHNAMRPLYMNKVIENKSLKSLNILSDPELTELGVDASIHNGCVITKLLKNLWKMMGNEKLKFDTVNLVCCSPLIRSMESAFYMTRKWRNPPEKIYVFPYLRELDESSKDKYSSESIQNIDSIPSYSMKSLNEQKEYLRSEGLLDFFDFSFVESNIQGRNEPGDIQVFVKWFQDVFLRHVELSEQNFNVFAVTHAGVLRDFSGQGFHNNSGFILNLDIDTDMKNLIYNTFVPFTNYLPRTFFTDYSNPEFANVAYNCPSKRCGTLCSRTKEDSTSIKRFTPISECNMD